MPRTNRRPRTLGVGLDVGLGGALRSELGETLATPDIATFARLLGVSLFPVQRALLRLVFLDVEHMSDWDKSFITDLARRFNDPSQQDVIGVPPDVWQRVR